MSVSLLSGEIKEHFDFLFDRGFAIRSISPPMQNMGNWIVTLESSQCIFRIISDHGEISLDVGPKSNTGVQKWFSINAVVFYITEGRILLEEFKEQIPQKDEQYRRLAKLLRDHLDKIIMLMGKDFVNHDAKLTETMRIVSRIYVKRYEEYKARKNS